MTASLIEPGGCFPKGPPGLMMGAMAIFPRPVSPKSAFADLLDVLSGPLPHKWPLLVLSVVLTAVIFWAFAYDTRPPKPERQIIYVESWMADRKDSTIIAEQKADLAAYEAALEKKQKEFQHVADMVGIEWREDEARNKTRRLAVIAAINKHLDEKIAAAKKREAEVPAAPASATPATPKP